MDNELVEYRGFFIFWRKPLNSGKWTAGITSGSPSLFPAIEPSGARVIGGHSRDDMLVNAKLYIDGMLDRSRGVIHITLKIGKAGAGSAFCSVICRRLTPGC